MRLVNTDTLALEEFPNNIPPYAILSHTWGKDEVSFADWKDLDAARKKQGFRKIELTCRQATTDGYQYAWVDTNCIDKSSSSELSEAINSMFAWYRDAQVCYVFLKDVVVDRGGRGGGGGDGGGEPASTPDSPPDTPPDTPPIRYIEDAEVRRAFKASAWFTRGWTLQELLAPAKVIFFSYEWRPLATKEDERRLISDITDIDYDYIKRPQQISSASVARRMSWMARRRTTRIEDTAYCLLGIFGIHMALLYGEGHRAFLRLQEEIIRVSNDQTIFCWQASMGRSLWSSPSSSSSSSFAGKFGAHAARSLFDDAVLRSIDGDDKHLQAQLETWTSILAPHPSVFRDSALYFSEFGNNTGFAAGGLAAGAGGPGDSNSSLSTGAVGPYSITNFGLSIALPLLYTAKGACAVLDVGHRRTSTDRASRVVIPLHRVQNHHYIRIATQLLVMMVPPALTATRTQIFVDCRNAQSRGAALLLSQRISARPINMSDVDKHPVIFLAFNRPVDIDRTPLFAADMDFVPFHSAVEVSSHRVGTQGAIILAGKAARTEPFSLLIGGRSSLVSPAIPADAYACAGSRSDTPPLTPNRRATDRTAELCVDWHADVLDRPTPPSLAGGNPTAVKLLIDRLSADYFGSWCTSRALRNVLSWPYASDGALVCYFELDDLSSQDNNGDAAAAADGRTASSVLALNGEAHDLEMRRFSHMMRSSSDTTSLRRLCTMLRSPAMTELP